MLRESLFAKIHMARVTAAKPDYVGSITIDADLLDACGMRVNDKVLISNCRNGERLETYIFRGKAGSGCIELNGAAAHLVEPGDEVIIMAFALMTEDEYCAHAPKVLIMNEDNSIAKTIAYKPHPVGHKPVRVSTTRRKAGKTGRR
ncbi:MAG: aspartate 1-decarboxylase [Phycisphaerales bacterium]